MLIWRYLNAMVKRLPLKASWAYRKELASVYEENKKDLQTHECRNMHTQRHRQRHRQIDKQKHWYYHKSVLHLFAEPHPPLRTDIPRCLRHLHQNQSDET